MGTLETHVHELGLRALTQQEAALNELRARTGTLLTAAALIASFVGAEALARDGLTVWVILALLAFGAAVLGSIYVLLPKDGLIFALDARVTYDVLAPWRDDEALLHRTLGFWMQTFRANNQPTIDRLTRAFRAASLALVAEIAFLALALALD